MLSFVGLSLVVVCVGILLTRKMSPLIAFTLIPVCGALSAGWSLEDVSLFFKGGLLKVAPMAVMFMFAILYFALMQEKGVFQPLIDWIIKSTQHRISFLTLGTVLIASMAHLDGSGASTFLITLPPLLPIYQRLKISPYLLLLLVSASASVMNMLPWAGPLGRAAGVIGADSTALWIPLIPIQGLALFLLLILAYFLGKKEEKKQHDLLPDSISTPKNSLVTPEGLSSDLSEPSSSSAEQVIHDLRIESPSTYSSQKFFWMNVTLTMGLLVLLILGKLSSPLSFMIALGVGLLINYPNQEDQKEFIQRHAYPALNMALILLAAGVFLGILKESGMLKALATDLIALLPSAITPKLHILVGFFGAPFELILNTDAYYFAVLPIVEQATAPFGIPSESVVHALVIGNIIGTFISPFSPALWLALGLLNLDMGTHIRYALGWIWGLSLVLLAGGWGLGLY